MPVALAESGFAGRFLDDLVHRAKRDRQRILLPEGKDERVLEAVARITSRGFCDITLFGSTEDLLHRCQVTGIDLDLSRVDVIDLADPDQGELRAELAWGYHQARKHKGVTPQQADSLMDEPAYAATMMVHLGYADGLVSGAAHTTAKTIRPALQVIGTREGISLVSSVFLMLLHDHALVFGDCAVNPMPTPDELAEIAVESAATARTFGIDPRVGMLSYSTGSSGSGAAVDAVIAATEMLRVREPSLPVAGPIQFDAAIHPAIAKKKMPDSDVAGRATVLVFPNLDSGNITYKAIQQTAGAVAVGPVLQGLAKPVNDLSRGCTVEDIVTTVAVTAVQAQSLRANPRQSVVAAS